MTTRGSRTLMDHLEQLKAMAGAMRGAKAGTYTKAAIERVEARVEEARAALKAEVAS